VVELHPQVSTPLGTFVTIYKLLLQLQFPLMSWKLGPQLPHTLSAMQYKQPRKLVSSQRKQLLEVGSKVKIDKHWKQMPV